MKKLIVANWKMYLNLSKSKALAKKITRSTLHDPRYTTILCPSFVALANVAKIIEHSKIKLGAQDVFCCDARGAYTGEIGLDDLKGLGVEYVLVGHSERRRYFKESDELVNQKLRVVLKSGMRPILCVGEPLKVRKAGQERRYVSKQVKEGLKGVLKKDLKRVVIAYEPIWAISGNKGHADNPKDAAEMHSYIRKVATEGLSFGRSKDSPSRLQVLYGGSINSKNFKKFLEEKEVSGFLIGKASTKFSELSKLCSQ